MSEFVHLHNHTDYSLLDGAAPIDRYIAKAKQYGMQHLAITDHGNMFGVLKFYKACKAQGINPIVGCEFYVNPESHTTKSTTMSGSRYYHLVLIAMNEQGYKNLMVLNSISYTEGYYYKPRISDQLLAEHNEGLICLSACLAGEIPQLLSDNNYEGAKQRALFYSSIFDDNRYYLELQDHGLAEQKQVNPQIVKLARELGLPVVATNDIHYIEDSDANAHDIVLCIGTNKKKNDQDRMRFDAVEFYMKSPDAMSRLFDWIPEAIENTVRIAQRCDLTIDQPGPMLPAYEIPPEFENPDQYLRHIAQEGLAKRYPEITEELQKRLDYELDVIISMGFTGYFLIVWDFIFWAKQHGIPVGPGRGSGAGSLVAYSMTITDIDPIEYNLIFERFLNPERVSMPDFDIDFCYERRQEVIDYVTAKYGTDRVAQIATFGTLKVKAVLKDVARVLDIPFAEATRIVGLVPESLPDDETTGKPRKLTVQGAIDFTPELRELEQRGGIYAELFDVAKRLEGFNRHTSTHAAGVVIGQSVLTNYVPLYRDPKTGAISTQYTMDMLEDCGLVKMDFLGLKTLTLIKHTEDLIKQNDPTFSIEEIDEQDTATFEMLGRGDSAGIFQFESAGMQRVLKDAKPNSIEDLVALNALYRPGPMAYIPKFIDSKNGRTAIEYFHPDLEPPLKTTYGVIVYQEQVMEVAQIIGGYSLGNADLLRRAMGKKKAEVMEKEKKNFIRGAQEKGYSKEIAEGIFEMLLPFAGYGFNKSHAAAYSVVAYQTAYLKANYPAEFMAANLTNEMNSPDKFAQYLIETKTMGLEITPPSINNSGRQFSVVDGKIVYGLQGIKHVGEAAVESILRERNEHGPYKNFLDFLYRSEPRALNSKLLESLIQSGAFDGLGNNRPTLMANVEAAVKYAQKKRENEAFGQASLFDAEEEAAMETFEMELLPDSTLLEKLEIEKDLLGFYVSGHPMDMYRDVWKRTVTIDLGQPERLPTGRAVNLVAMVTGLREITTKGGAGDRMAFLQLSDFNGTIEAVAFPKIWKECEGNVKTDGIFGFKGKFETRQDKLSFLLDAVVDPKQLEPEAIREAHVVLVKDLCTQTSLRSIMDTCITYKGVCSLLIHLLAESKDTEEVAEGTGQAVRTDETIVKAGREFSVGYSDDFISALREHQAVSDIWFN
ncbi:MAG TPA: DNA polymerase III subunit alpha [Sphaerochaeta sp.]|nr:MAG: DNA polymerase III subunit alpha [Spirochaetes bacterium GWC2_52_13]HCS35898.1 DNA polymerase III subunit alpha [Sphaerochaeta sp.]